MSERFQMRMTQQDRAMIQYVMEQDNIASFAGTVRSCVQQRAEALRRKEQRKAINEK